MAILGILPALAMAQACLRPPKAIYLFPAKGPGTETGAEMLLLLPATQRGEMLAQC